MKIVPITYWTFSGDLYRLNREPQAMKRRIYIGLPFKMKDDENILSRSYIVLPLSQFFNPHIKREAARLNGIVTRTVLGNPDRNAGWHDLMAMEEIRHLMQDRFKSEAWTYMIIEAVLRERPLEYLEGRQHIGDFFAERFQLEFGFDLSPPLIREQFHKHLLDRAYIEASLDLKIDMAFRQEEIVSNMEGLQIIGETYMEVMIVLMGFLTGVTGMVVIDIILEAFIGYFQFLFELEKAEKDGIVTEEEAFGAWFSLAGVFLPFARILPDAFRMLVEMGLTIVGVAMILLQIVIALFRAAAGFLEAMTADLAGFDSYAQYDPENTIFIPA